MDPEPIYIILLILLLTLINAFFVLCNTSVIQSNKNKVKDLIDDGNEKAQKLLDVLESENKYEATMQFAIVLSTFFTSAISVVLLAPKFARVFHGMNPTGAYWLSAIIIILVITLVNVIFGVLIPTKIAANNPEKIAMKTIGIGKFFVFIYSPLVIVSFYIAKGVLYLFRIKLSADDDKADEDQIMELVEDGVISDREKEMIDSVFEFNDISCEEIMTPRKEVYMIDINAPLKEYVDEMIDESYSRIPVYENDIDNIIGILYLKDFLLEARKVGFENVDIRKIIREPLFVPARKKINELFKELQLSKTHLAILIDEYGGFSGIVTNEDLVEEIMGEIDDEFDDEDEDIKHIHDNVYKVKGIVTIKELNDGLNLELDEDSQDYDTLGGLILFLLDRIPNDDEKPEVEFKDIKFKVVDIENRHIESVIVTLPEIKEEDKKEDKKENKKEEEN